MRIHFLDLEVMPDEGTGDGEMRQANRPQARFSVIRYRPAILALASCRPFPGDVFASD
jgi:hypothetical protein